MVHVAAHLHGGTARSPCVAQQRDLRPGTDDTVTQLSKVGWSTTGQAVNIRILNTISLSMDN